LLRPVNYVPTATFQSLLVTLVISRLDYGNSLLIGLLTRLVCCLQSVHNAGAQFIFKLRRFDRITDSWVSLH